MGGLALLSSLADLFAQGGQAKGELNAEAIAKQQREFEQRQKQQALYSQLETAALNRKRTQQQIDQEAGNPLDTEIKRIEGVMGRKLTDEEKQRHFGIAPKEIAPKSSRFGTFVPDSTSPTGWSRDILDGTTLAPTGRKDVGLPMGALPTYHTNYKVKTNQDGSQELVPVTTTSGKVLPGGKAATAPSPAGPLARKPRTASAGATAAKPSASGGKSGVIPFGHKPLSTVERRTLVAARQINSSIDRIETLIATQPTLANNNSPITPAIDWAEYQHGHFEPSDPVRAQLIKEAALVGITGVSLYSQGRMSRYLFDKAQQHLPQPNDSPKLLLSKVKWLKDNGIIDELIQATINPLGGNTGTTPASGGGKTIVVRPEDMH